MIIGKGMIANSFEKFLNDSSVIIFASGVSNSQEMAHEAFLREKTLLLESLDKYKTQIFVYFSTCSIYDPSMKNNLYVCHKIEMEELVKQHAHHYIFRLPQVVGVTNSPTLINTLSNKIKNKEPFELWSQSSRNLIDVRDVYRIVSLVIEKQIYYNFIYNIAAPKSHSIIEIVRTMEDILKQKAIYSVINKGATYTINVEILDKVLSHTDILFNDKYMQNILKHYISIT